MRRPRTAVIGGGLGGLTAAGLLARAGVAVTLFEAEERLGGKAQSLRAGGVTLDTGPTLLAMPGIVRETFARLGAADLLPDLIDLPLQCEYHFADGARLAVHRDLGRTAADAEAIAAGAGGALERFYAEAEKIYGAAGEPYLEAPFEGTIGFARRVAGRGWRAVARGARLGSLAGLAARHFQSAHLRQFVGRFATYAGASPWEASAAYALIPHVERAFGVHHVRGGMAALATALEEALARLGADVRRGARVAWRARGGGFEVGVDAEPFDALVVNADPLGSDARGPLTLSGYVLLLHAGQRLPLPHHAILFSGDYRAEFAQLRGGQLPADPTLHLCHPAATDASMAAAGTSGLYVMANVPPLAPGVREWAAEAAAMRARCLARLERALPGLGRQLTVIGERTPMDFARQGAPRGSLYGFLPRGRLGPFRRPRMRGRPAGLFFAGGGTHPGGGVPLVMRSGRFAAEMALAHLETRRAA